METQVTDGVTVTNFQSSNHRPQSKRREIFCLHTLLLFLVFLVIFGFVSFFGSLFPPPFAIKSEWPFTSNNIPAGYRSLTDRKLQLPRLLSTSEDINNDQAPVIEGTWDTSKMATESLQAPSNHLLARQLPHRRHLRDADGDTVCTRDRDWLMCNICRCDVFAS